MRLARTIDEHIRGLPGSTQRLLRQMRRTIRAAAPETTETISYGIPTFKLDGKNLVHFAGYKHHIGFYPGSEAIRVFKAEFARYKTSKGTVQFPIDKPLPLALVRKIVLYRVATSTPPDPFVIVAGPARRAMANAGIDSVKQLARRTERQVANLHGMGPTALSKLKALLRKNRLKFKKEKYLPRRGT